MTSSVEARVESALGRSSTCELAMGPPERPVVTPVTPLFDPERGTIVVTSPPAYAEKVTAMRTHPQVALRLYQAKEPIEVHGRASVREDDPFDGAAELRSLIFDGPDTPKRRVMESMQEALETGAAHYLMDWYRLRIVVDIEPDAVRDLDDVKMASVSPWPSVGIDEREGASYERVLLGTVEDGQPTTRAVTDLVIDGGDALLTCAGEPPVGQPACLLCHWHTFDLDDLEQRVIRGRLLQDGRFRPASSFHLRNETTFDALRFVLGGKRRTRKALGVRNPLRWTWDV